MENVKIISFLGMERCDLVYFLAKSFEDKKYRTLVIDNSCSHDLFLSLKRENENTDYVEHGRSVYMRNKYVDPENAGAFEKFDVVVIYHGLNVNYDLLEMSDKVVLMTDYLPVTHRNIIDYIDMEYVNTISKEKLYFVLRDKPSFKISEQYILRILGITGIDYEAVIDYDEGNYNAYINYCYNGSQSFKGLSSDMRMLLKNLMEFLFQNEKRRKGK